MRIFIRHYRKRKYRAEMGRGGSVLVDLLFSRGGENAIIPSGSCHRVMWDSTGGTLLKTPPLSAPTPEP